MPHAMQLGALLAVLIGTLAGHCQRCAHTLRRDNVHLPFHISPPLSHCWAMCNTPNTMVKDVITGVEIQTGTYN